VDKLSVALALLLAVAFLGETISVRGALGAGLILAGTVVLVWA
jgi:transporter family protein